MVQPEETIIEEAEPSLEQQLAQLQMQAHEQGYQAGIAEGRQQGHKQGYQGGLAQGLEQGLAEAKFSNKCGLCPDAATGQRISNYP